MGQKVNPISNRLLINREFDSCWFSDFYYSDCISHELKIKQYLDLVLKHINCSSGRIAFQQTTRKSLVNFFFYPDQKSFIKRKNYIKKKQPVLEGRFCETRVRSSKCATAIRWRAGLGNSDDPQGPTVGRNKGVCLLRPLLDLEKSSGRCASTTAHVSAKHNHTHTKEDPQSNKSAPPPKGGLSSCAGDRVSPPSVYKKTFLENIPRVCRGYRWANLSNRAQFSPYSSHCACASHYPKAPDRGRGSPRRLTPIEANRHSRSLVYIAAALPNRGAYLPRAQREQSGSLSYKYMRAHSCSTFASVKAAEVSAARRLRHERRSRSLVPKIHLHHIETQLFKIKGLRISCSGRASKKAGKAKTLAVKYGSTSLNMFYSETDFASKTANTRFGAIGVKVWVSY
ncbi:ribosomal protein S3 (mitochondrion) [Bryopsis sp. KO-2023]|nr:ribosomal protein S3 [Bryopsis sp. KO-2023]